MNFVQQLLEAFTSLAANKLRTGLTMLGIVIGVAAVISMLAIGKGAQASIDNQINSIGSNLIYVISGAEGVKNIRRRHRSAKRRRPSRAATTSARTASRSPLP
jgi:ABC-type antimicrobial peptide transport system permease subunit